MDRRRTPRASDPNASHSTSPDSGSVFSAYTRVAAALLAATLVACASTAPQGPSPLEIAGQSAATIAIAPINLMIQLPPELETSTDLVSNGLRAFIESHKRTVIPIDYRTGREIWAASIKEASHSDEPKTFESAARIFAQRLQESVEFDALIIPSIFLQNANWRGRVGKWDGARQRIESTGAPMHSSPCVRGKILKGVSLSIRIFDRHGEAIHSTQSGLEVLHHIEVGPDRSRGGNPITCRIVKNNPAVQDKERVRAAVMRGLAPFLPNVPLVVQPDNGRDEI